MSDAWRCFAPRWGTDEVPVTIENVMQWGRCSAYMAERFQVGAHLPRRRCRRRDAAQRWLRRQPACNTRTISHGSGGGAEGIAGAEFAFDGTERRPTAAFTVEQAYSRYVTRSAPYLRSENMQPIENDLNIELGYCYELTAVIPDSGEKRAAHSQPPRNARAPWNTRAARRARTQRGEDLF